MRGLTRIFGATIVLFAIVVILIIFKNSLVEVFEVSSSPVINVEIILPVDKDEILTELKDIMKQNRELIEETNKTLEQNKHISVNPQDIQNIIQSFERIDRYYEKINLFLSTIQ